MVIAGMSMENVLPRLIEGARRRRPRRPTDVLLGDIVAQRSSTFPSLAGIVLNGGFPLPDEIERLIDGLGVDAPDLATDLGTYETAVRSSATRRRLAADSQRRYDTALALFERTSTPRRSPPRSGSPRDSRDAAHVRVRADRARPRRPQAHRAARGR